MTDLDYKIIDIHTHMGAEYPLYYPDHDAHSIVKFLDEVGVEFIISAPCEDLFTSQPKRRAITSAMAEYPERIKGYYSFNPQDNTPVKEITDAFLQHPGYIGIKLLPDYHRTRLSDSAYKPVLLFANKHNMLVLSHTWGGFMNNENCDNAKEVESVLSDYPNIRFIMGHSIQGQTDAAIELAICYPNAYLDLCDTGRINGIIEKMVRRAGAKKVLFGTDLPMQSTLYVLGAVKNAEITEKQRRLILRDNALRILSEVGRPKE